MKIGLLGGSFNPAHTGHLHISEIALKKLGLSQVWWLVSPQNPLKPQKGMESFENRLQSARQIACNPKIKVLDIETRLKTQYTIDVLYKLTAKYPATEFVWLMGADNLISFPRWKKWEEILQLVKVHVFDRAEFFYPATASRQYQKYKNKITYHRIRKSNLSSTKIRELI